MNSPWRTDTTESSTSLFPEANVPVLPAPCSIDPRGNRESKKNCITGLWDLNIPSELLQEILSRLGLKDNIHASLVCKTWCEAAVFVRKLQPRPWLFYPQERSKDGGDFILSDPSDSQTYKLNFPELKKLHRFSYSRDGWLLVLKYVTKEVFLLNPFTREHIYLPELPLSFSGHCLAFSAAPTSSSCSVISLCDTIIFIYISIYTLRSGETVWTTYRFENQLVLFWAKCVFSNGLFYCLSTCGFLGVFDPSEATWNNLPVKPYPVSFDSPMLMTEHEGDIFVIFRRDNNNPLVFKLNLNGQVWEETRELGGLTVFASRHVSLTRAGLPSEMRNRIYIAHIDDYGLHDRYYSLGDEKSSRPPIMHVLPHLSVCVDPPHNVDL